MSAGIYFKRKSIIFIFLIFAAVMILFSGLIQITTNNYRTAIFQILVALFFAYDAYVYIRPYLGLNEEKLVVNYGLAKKEIIFLQDVTLIDERNKKLIITFNKGPATMKLKILLSHLNKHDKEQFLMELKSKLGDKVCVG